MREDGAEMGRREEPGNIKVNDTNEEPGLEIYHEIKVEVVFDNAGVLSDTECLQGK